MTVSMKIFRYKKGIVHKHTHIGVNTAMTMKRY